MSDKDKILDLFLNTKDNSVPEISRKTGFSHSLINKIINEYFKK